MNRQYLAGAGVFLVVLAALLWMFWPAPTSSVDVVESKVEVPVVPKLAKRTAMQLAEEKWLPLEEDPNIPVVTSTCKWIVTDERRNVPQWVMLDNLRDRGQLFVEDDIRCLTAAGVTPALLDFAERYQDLNKAQGRVGRPPGQ